MRGLNKIACPMLLSFPLAVCGEGGGGVASLPPTPALTEGTPTGSLAGAFLGPVASEIGGTFIIPDPPGSMFTLAFTAAKD